MPLPASEALDLLINAHAQGRFSHAYLVTGARGSGKKELAQMLCARLLDCRTEKVPSHPDVHWLAPESKSRQLSVEQIRGLEQKLRMRSLSGGKKFAVLQDADRLGTQAANAFLKTLEEPPSDTHIILLTEQPEQLLDTILSRCVQVSLRPTKKAERQPAEIALIRIIETFFKTKKADLRGGLWLAQQIQLLLAETKEAIQSEMEAEARAEEKQYKQVVDAKWFEKREDLFAAKTQSLYLAERSRVLEMLEAFWTDVLLIQQKQEARHLPECGQFSHATASTLSVDSVLKRIQSVTDLREHVQMSGVNEALALEHGILGGFAPEP
jgi:DNA polymerase-3 subunit delta'